MRWHSCCHCCSALARKNGYELKYNQEIVALGVANFAGALFSSYTTTGSFSRSAINNSCGAKTPLAGFITGIIVMCVLLFLTPIFRLMPYNVMGAIIIVGGGWVLGRWLAGQGSLKQLLMCCCTWHGTCSTHTYTHIQTSMMAAV